MKRHTVETLLGAAVLIIAGFFLVYSAEIGGVNTGSDTYTITADFSEIGGLKSGDAVQISGVKVGNIAKVDLVPESFLARVYMNVDKGVELPSDTSALISSESLLGGRYLALQPGADELLLENDGHINYTQAPQNLEQLLGQFIFSASNNNDDDEK